MLLLRSLSINMILVILKLVIKCSIKICARQDFGQVEIHSTQNNELIQGKVGTECLVGETCLTWWWGSDLEKLFLVCLAPIYIHYHILSFSDSLVLFIWSTKESEKDILCLYVHLIIRLAYIVTHFMFG